MMISIKNTTSEYFEGLRQRITGKIQCLSDDEILTSDIDELFNYYYQNNEIQKIALFLDHKDISFSETKVKRRSYGYRADQEFIDVDGYKITFEIPFDGDKRLLRLKPSRWSSAGFPEYNVIDYSDTEYSKIAFILYFVKDEIPDDVNSEFVENQFKSQFKNHIETINNLNDDASQFNATLSNLIKNALDARKKKVNDFIILAEKMEISLRKNPNAPNVKPIILKKTIKKLPEMPKKKQQENYYTIPDNDYSNIRQIISLAGFSFEKAAKNFTNFEEETLRDILISHLNTHYLGTATAETFSKNGKTDIRLQFENKAAFIAECKIWHGEKSINNALEQLFSYTSWRDVKTSLVIFNKNNKNFNKVLDTIKYLLEINILCKKYIQIYRNEWLCDFFISEENTGKVTVQIIASLSDFLCK